jgi:para-nitrobenzyl esterase
MNKKRHPALTALYTLSCISFVLIFPVTGCMNQGGKEDTLKTRTGLFALSGRTVSGQVLRDGSGMGGLIVTLNTWNGTGPAIDATTGTDGNYIFENVSSGYYRVTVDLSADYGKSISRNVNKVNNRNLTAIDFIIDTETQRTISYGDVVGLSEDNGVHAWMGIPYAKPPTGALRWRAPQAPVSWTTYPAIAKCQVCPQFAEMLSDAPTRMFGETIGSEDCLYLNVWAPAFTTVPAGGDRVPVMVWLHGGGNSVGEGGIYNGKYLAEAYNVIFVSINYRLGPLGWLSHPDLRAEAGTTAQDQSGNFGTLDIIQALNWVKNNISAFGGDPSRVTLLGQSAGAADTLTMMASPLAAGLFQRAVVQSAGLDWSTRTEAEEYRESGGHDYSSREVINKLLISDGAAADRAGAKTVQDGMSPAEISTYLRSKTAYELLSVYSGYYGGMISMPYMFRDGTVLPDAVPLSLFQAGTYTQVPCILGTNRDEAKLFLALDPDYTRLFFGKLPVVKDKTYYTLSSRYLSDLWKVRAVDEIAAALRANQGDTVYAYRFDWDEEPSVLGVDLGFVIGAAHGLEITSMMNNSEELLIPSMKNWVYGKGNRAGRVFLAGCMSSYWAQFAATGIPGNGFGGAQTTTWQPWDSAGGGQKMMIFDTLEDNGVRMSTTTVTRDGLKAELQTDTGFTTQQQKCTVYHSMFGSDAYYTANCTP